MIYLFFIIRIYFSPNGGATEAIVNEINAARVTIKIQAYSFTSKPIADALGNAKKRNVNVLIILDEKQRKAYGAKWPQMIDNGIPIVFDAMHAIAHNKIIIIDDKITITGSFNFTANAEKHNAENLLIIDDQEVTKQYINNWNNHLKHSRP